MSFQAPYPPYDPLDKTGFSYETVVKRWPVILTGIVDRLHRICHDLTMEAQKPGDESGKQSLEEKITEAKDIISSISKLKYQMGGDKKLPPIFDDKEADVKIYNTELEKLDQNNQGSWFTAPWLYAECYLYRLIRSYLSQTSHWKSYDPFFSQKQETLQGSGKAIYQIATTFHELEGQKDILESDPDKLEVLFKEMIQMSLWGNATDLSLLTHLTLEDIAHLQSVGKEAQQAQKEFILRDDQEAVWSHLKGLKGERIDFVLDNAGFELFTDLVFADFLVTYTPYVSKVIFHPKLFPWFVSDVTPPDFADLFKCLLSSSFFPSSGSGESTDADSYLKAMVTRWGSYVDSGVFELSVPRDTQLGSSNQMANFWTEPWPYWNMEEKAPVLFKSLESSGLVVFKGDLNYRKLTGDVKWPVTTPFETAIGPLAGSFPLLSLRTNKADVVVGVEQSVADRLDERGEKWRVNGRYALVSFMPKRNLSS